MHCMYVLFDKNSTMNKLHMIIKKNIDENIFQYIQMNDLFLTLCNFLRLKCSDIYIYIKTLICVHDVLGKHSRSPH